MNPSERTQIERRIRLKWIAIGGVLLSVLGVLALQVGLPLLLSVMPGAYRVYLPEPILRRYAEPLPTALPTAETAVLPQITLQPLLHDAEAASQEDAVLMAGEAETPEPTLTVSNSPTPDVEALGQGDVADMADKAETPEPTPTLTPTVPPLPTSARLEGIEIIPQKFNNCGPTNLTMVLGYFGHETDQLTVGNQLKPNREDRNVSPWELVLYAEQQAGLGAISGSGGDLQLLKRLLAAGYPVIVEKGVEENAWQGWLGHYVTLVGYEEEMAEFMTFDTLLGPWDSSGKPQSYESLLEAWQHFNYAFVVLFPPDEAAAVQTLLGEPFGNSARMWRQAAAKAQAEAQAMPDNAFAWFNLGTSLMALGRETEEIALLNGAAQAFDQGRALGLPPRMLWYQFEIYEAYLANGRFEDVLLLTEATLATQGGRSVEESYLYRGHALLAMGDARGARAAYERALRVNAHFAEANVALVAISN